MKFRFWKFALLAGAVVAAAASINTNNLEYMVSWIIAVTSVSLLGFYLTERVRFFVNDSDGDKQKPAPIVNAPCRHPAPPEPAQPGLTRAPAFIFR